MITRIDGVDFDEAWAERERGALDGLPVHFISMNLLLKNKRAAGRDKDLSDVKVLERLIAAERGS
ncbi:MAG: hypothetical protein AAGA56_22120 [Myxococcota bacterium]